jgi:hypothetical protein
MTWKTVIPGTDGDDFAAGISAGEGRRPTGNPLETRNGRPPFRRPAVLRLDRGDRVDSV